MNEQEPIFHFCLDKQAAADKEHNFMPTKGEPDATGYDVRAFLPDGPMTFRPTERALIPLGFKVFCPKGWWFEIRPRSSTYAKKHLGSLYGIVDEGYEGKVLFACQYLPELCNAFLPLDRAVKDHGAVELTIKHGDAIAQIVPVRRQEMRVVPVSEEEYEQLSLGRKSARGTGGFGSTTEEK